METPNSITPDSYQQLALRTESPPANAQFVRFLVVRHRIGALFDILRPVLLEIDAIKKYIFYGKESAKFGFDLIEDPDAVNGVYTDDERKFLRYLHAVLGVISEGEEMITPVQAGIKSPASVNTLNANEEFGDTQWYVGVRTDALGFKLSAVMRANVGKLAARFPDKFSEDKANNRDLDKEVAVMQAELDK